MAEAWLGRKQFEANVMAAAMGNLMGGVTPAQAGQVSGNTGQQKKRPKKQQVSPLVYAEII